MRFTWKLGIFLLSIVGTLQHSTPSSPTYIGAVAECSPVLSDNDGKKAADINADNYVKFIEKAVEYNADILVFPESSLSVSTSQNISVARIETASYVPAPSDKVIPCDDNANKYTYVLKTLSCAARKHNIYVAINLDEKLDCQGTVDCPIDGLLTYNTNVVFDREGRVIARYRKVNLFGEPGTNVTAEPEIATFETDFGVKFGIFICFDILFWTPALNYTNGLGLTDIIFSTQWYPMLPFMFAVQVQAGWSYANDVNFLAAGHNYQKTNSSGSGIYIGRKGYINVINEDKHSNILVVGEIPKVINGSRFRNIDSAKSQVYKFSKSEISTTEPVGTGVGYSYRIEDLGIYTTELVDVTQSSHSKTLCDRNFCCEFQLKIGFNEDVIKINTDYYRYRLAVFNGTRSLTVTTGGSKVCGIISCTDDTLDSCGHTFKSNKTIVTPTSFELIEIFIQNTSNQNIFFMPTSISKNMMPVNASDFIFDSVRHGKTSSYMMKLTKSRSDLLTFAIFGRNFAADGSELSKPSSAIVMNPSLFINIVFAYLLVYM